MISTRFVKKIVLFENSNHKFRDKNIDKFLIKMRSRNFITKQQKKQIVISNDDDYIQSLNVLKSDEKNNENAFFVFSNIFKISNKFSTKTAEKQRMICFDRSISKTDFSIFFNFKIMQFSFVRFVKKTISKKIQKFTVVFDVFEIKIENNELIWTKNSIIISFYADCLICAKYDFYCKRE